MEQGSTTITKFPFVLDFVEGCVTFHDRSSWEFKAGEYTIKHYADGSIRVGTFDRLGNHNGTGYYRLSNGSVYDGQFQDNLPHGIGLFRYTAGEIRYCRGSWNKGFLEGDVNIIYFNKNIYMGRFYNGKPHGRGEMKFHDKKMSYSGTWENGIAVGSGTIHYVDCQYVGQISNCIPHGYGSFIDKSGEICYGKWIHGVKEVKKETPLTDEELCHVFDGKKVDKAKPKAKVIAAASVPVVQPQQESDKEDDKDDDLISFHPSIRRKEVTLGAFISSLTVSPIKEKKRSVFFKNKTTDTVTFLNHRCTQTAINAAIERILIIK